MEFRRVVRRRMLTRELSKRAACREAVASADSRGCGLLSSANLLGACAQQQPATIRPPLHRYTPSFTPEHPLEPVAATIEKHKPIAWARSADADASAARDELWIVNTRFSCLCTLDAEYSFVPRWRPPFISVLAAEDRCHLNGLALVDGRPGYVTARGTTDMRDGWRADKAHGGCVVDTASGEFVAGGGQPHANLALRLTSSCEVHLCGSPWPAWAL